MRSVSIRLISSVIVLSLGISAAEGADPNLIGWWKLDEGSGTTTADSSGSGLDGTFVGDPSWTDGMFGKALSLDGDYVDLGDDPKFDITGQITVTAWFKVNAFDRSWATIISKGD
ncbi:MAG: hypothetical protein ACYSWQ_21445, partial [Planctomycetota bacterium]